MSEKQTLDRLGKLADKLREVQAQAHEITEEMRTLIHGGVGVADFVAECCQFFDTVWCGRYAPGTSGQYLWSYARDKAQIKRLLQSLSADEIQARMLVYLKSSDPFYCTARHPFALFVTSINRHVPDPVQSVFSLEAPADCRHTPVCRSDQDCTRKRSAELRG